MPQSVRHFEITRNVALPRAEVWELLANNDRFNQVMELPPVDFGPPSGSLLVREARAKFKNFLPMRWKEHPFQWVKNEEYTVLRVYEQGPLRRLVIGIRLSDAAPECTLVRIFADMEPRNALMAALMPLVSKQLLQKTAQYCEDTVALRRAGRTRALPFNRFQSAVEEAVLQPLVERLKDTPVPSELIPRLVECLREADDNDVAGLRPKYLARLWDASDDDVLRLCLYATKIGLLNLSWREMCPNCRVSKTEVSSLLQLAGTVHCDLCGVNYAVNFDRYVELRFAVHPEVRAASAAVYCIGSPFLTPHVLAQVTIESGGTTQIAIPEIGEPLRLRVLRLNHVVELQDTSLEAVIYRDEGWGAERIGAPPGAMLVIDNQSARDIVVALEKLHWDKDALTAAEITSMREFREMFSTEVLAPGQSVSIESLTLFFSDLCDSTELYENVGDAPAYGRVRRYFLWMADIIGAHHGAVVKTIGDAVMAVFQSPEDALHAALEIQKRAGEFNASLPAGQDISIRIGLHHGPAIAINSNGRLDYFGRTVNLAARIESAGSGGDIVFSDEVGSRPGVLDILRLEQGSLQSEHVNFKGIEGQQLMRRISIRPNSRNPLLRRDSPL